MSHLTKIERKSELSDENLYPLTPVNTYSKEEIELLKSNICKGATDDEFKLFLRVCKKTGLDPFSKQIYCIPRKDRNGGNQMLFMTGIDGYRLVAQRTKERDGEGVTEWCGEDGRWVDVWLNSKPPAAARVTIYRKGQTHPYHAIAKYSEYMQGTYDRPVGIWAKMPANQLAKCAESLALRKAFPQELSGLNTKEEMEQAENTNHVTAHVVEEIAPKLGMESSGNASIGENIFSLSLAKVKKLLENPLTTPDEISHFIERVAESKKLSEAEKNTIIAGLGLD